MAKNDNCLLANIKVVKANKKWNKCKICNYQIYLVVPLTAGAVNGCWNLL